MAKSDALAEKLAKLKEKKGDDPEHSPEEVEEAERLLAEEEKEKQREVAQKERERIEAMTPREHFIDWRARLVDFFEREMAQFRLRVHDTAETELIVYQGTLGNVWMRASPQRMRFYRTSLERRLEREGLIDTTNQVGVRFS